MNYSILLFGLVSQVLGVARHKVNVKVKRIGGGFGGKESACGLFASAAATAAVKYILKMLFVSNLAIFRFRQPVSFVVERFDDMVISGTRHPFHFNYKVNVLELIYLVFVLDCCRQRWAFLGLKC